MTVHERIAPGSFLGRPVASDEGRQGYRLSHVLPGAYGNVPERQMRVLNLLRRYFPDSEIEVRESSSGRYWFELAETHALAERIRAELERVHRTYIGSYAQLAEIVGGTVSTVRRIVLELVERGMATVAPGRGRYARTVIRLIASSIVQPDMYRDGRLTDALRSIRARVRQAMRYRALEITDTAQLAVLAELERLWDSDDGSSAARWARSWAFDAR